MQFWKRDYLIRTLDNKSGSWIHFMILSLAIIWQCRAQSPKLIKQANAALKLHKDYRERISGVTPLFLPSLNHLSWKQERKPNLVITLLWKHASTRTTMTDQSVSKNGTSFKRLAVKKSIYCKYVTANLTLIHYMIDKKQMTIANASLAKRIRVYSGCFIEKCIYIKRETSLVLGGIK